MRRPLPILLLASLTILLAACALQPPAPKTIVVSEARLAQLISGQFPFNSPMLEVLDVEISTPHITLDPVARK